MNEVTKKKIFAVANKVVNSKVCKGIEKGAIATSAALATMGAMSVSAFAEGTTTPAFSVPTELIMESASPFFDPALTVMCIVGGFGLGRRFLRGSMH